MILIEPKNLEGIDFSSLKELKYLRVSFNIFYDLEKSEG
jgi:hypothetical protein